MSRKKADANLLDMPGVPAVPKSPFSAGAGAAALKPVTQTAAVAKPKLSVPKAPAAPMTRTESPARQAEIQHGILTPTAEATAGWQGAGDWRAAARRHITDVQNRGMEGMSPAQQAEQWMASRPRPFVAPPVQTPTAETPGYSEYQQAIPNTNMAHIRGSAVDVNSPDVAKSWAAQRVEEARRRHYGYTPKQLEQQFNPEEAARTYMKERFATDRDDTETNQQGGPGVTGWLNRASQFVTPDQTGKYRLTPNAAMLGSGPGSAGAAALQSVSHIAPAVAAVATAAPRMLAQPVYNYFGLDSKPLENFSPLASSFRGLAAGPNYLLGTNFGHDWGRNSQVSTPYDVNADQKPAFTGEVSRTTPTLFGPPVYEPTTNTMVPSTLTAAGGQAKAYAKDPNNGASPAERILASTVGTGLTHSGDAYGALTGGSLIGSLGKGLKGMQAMGQVQSPQAAARLAASAWNASKARYMASPLGAALVQGGLTMADPNVGGDIPSRALTAAGEVLNTTYAPLAASPVVAASGEAMDQAGVQDIANRGGNYIRDTIGDETSPKWQRALAETLAGGVESLPLAASSLLNPKTLLQRLPAKQYIANVLKNTRNNAALLGAAGAAGGGLSAAATPTPTTPDELAQAAAQSDMRHLPVAEQKAKQLEQFYEASDLARQAHNLPTTQPGTVPQQEAVAQAAPAQPAQQPTEFAYENVVPTYPKAQQFAETNPKMTAQITAEATRSLQAKATTSEGKAVLAHVDKTGELPPAADEVAQYNLINDGFDADKIGEWYGNLGGAEKFALWGGVSMTVLGLMHAMNGGGVGGMLAALLGLGTAGLTIGQSGLFGDAAQEQSQKITQPVGSAISGGLTAVAGKALSNPSILKAVAPHLDSLPDGIRDSALQKMQDYMRQSKDPEMLENVSGLDIAAGKGMLGFVGSGPARTMAINKLVSKGFTPTTANRFVDLWAKQQ